MFVSLSLLAGPALAEEATDDGAVSEILDILKQRGLVDDAEYNRLAAKNAAYEEEHHPWLPRIEFSGDFRSRYEGFFFSRDKSGSDPPNRSRIRYRLRIAGMATVNEWTSVHFRLVSGNNDNRSTNQTLGSTLDFDSDPIQIDHAYVALQPPSSWIPLPEGALKLEFGKVGNPFLWKVGKDFMLWDNDISPEGVTLKLTTRPAEGLQLFANTGYYIIDENSAAKDPHLWGLQVGGHFDASDDIRLGARTSYYRFNSLNMPFVVRSATGAGGITSGGGSILDGLDGSATGADDIGVIEAGGYVRFGGFERWPILVYGDWSQNLDARDSTLFPRASQQDDAWGAGLEVGDKKEVVLLGVGYWHIEANAFPTMYIDSDLFDGFTNRKGWAFYGSRAIMKNTEVNLTVFVSDDIENTLPAYGSSVPGSDRVRLQADMVFKF